MREDCIRRSGIEVYLEGVLHCCDSFSTSDNMRNAPRRQSRFVPAAASAEVSVLNRKLQRSSAKFQYRRTKIEDIHIPCQSELGDDVYLESFIPSVHKSSEKIFCVLTLFKTLGKIP